MFTTKFQTDNAAFGDGNRGAEVARILRALATSIEDGDDAEGTVWDVNGNAVGTYELTGGYSE